MAFEGLNSFTDHLVKQYQLKQDVRHLITLYDYGEYALSSAKFKGQRRYLELSIYEACPSFYKGAYKRDKPK